MSYRNWWKLMEVTLKTNFLMMCMVMRQSITLKLDTVYHSPNSWCITNYLNQTNAAQLQVCLGLACTTRHLIILSLSTKTGQAKSCWGHNVPNVAPLGFAATLVCSEASCCDALSFADGWWCVTLYLQCEASGCKVSGCRARCFMFCGDATSIIWSIINFAC